MAMRVESKESVGKERPLVGLSAIIIDGGSVLLGKRKGSHGAGTWSFPGGHFEFGETFEDCLYREIKEEVGLKRKNLRQIDSVPCAVTNDYFKDEGKHYVTLFFRFDYLSGKIKNKELEKCDGWEWYDWGNLPSGLFLPVKNLIKQNYDPFGNLFNNDFLYRE